MLEKLFPSKGWLYPFILLVVVLAGCGHPTPPDLPELPNGWNRIVPAGETVCANGSECAFYFAAGDLRFTLFSRSFLHRVSTSISERR